MNENNKKVFIKIAFSVLLIVIFLVVFYLIFNQLGLTKLTREQIQKTVESTGAVAPLVFIGVSFLQVTFIPIPGLVTILAGSYIFGIYLSFIYSYIGMLIGSFFAWWLGRVLGRPFVNWVAGGKENVDEWLKKLKGREKVFLFFAFLLPLFPDDLLCSVAGILPIKFVTFTVMQVITRATSIGASLLFMSGEIIPYHGWGLIIISAVTILGITAFILAMKYAEKLNVFFDKFINRLTKKTKP